MGAQGVRLWRQGNLGRGVRPPRHRVTLAGGLPATRWESTQLGAAAVSDAAPAMIGVACPSECRAPNGEAHPIAMYAPGSNRQAPGVSGQAASA
jgi:hypothetical protein